MASTSYVCPIKLKGWGVFFKLLSGCPLDAHSLWSLSLSTGFGQSVPDVQPAMTGQLRTQTTAVSVEEEGLRLAAVVRKPHMSLCVKT